jgi:membrane-bound lytic murein transglycosylase D
MKRHTIGLLLFLAPIALLASVKDSLSQGGAVVPIVINDSNETVDPVLIDTIVSIDTVLNIDAIDPLQSSAVCISHDIVQFEFNKIPVTEELFKYHTSTRDFEVPMEYNNLVKRQIDYFGTRWQPKLKEMLSKSQYFFPLYEQILSENDMPMEIKYLSIIESGLNPFAGSRVGAVGAWQFMPATGRMFDLEISSKVDERRSLEKSTRAACKYLKQMNGQYDDWLVALASYNCGPGNVRKAMRRSGRQDFWGMYNYLPRETQNYVPKFIAMTYMMNFYDAYGITPAPIADSLYRMEQVFCEEALDFETIAEKIGVNKERLLKCNPEMKTTEIPFDGKGYVLFVPEGTSHLFYEHQQDIQSISVIRTEEKRIAEANRPKVVYHYVRRGESLILIARRHGVTVNQLKMWNGIRGSTIYAKQRLKVNRS